MEEHFTESGAPVEPEVPFSWPSGEAHLTSSPDLATGLPKFVQGLGFRVQGLGL